MDIAKTISDWVDEHRDDMLDLLANLVAARTENPPGNKGPIAAVALAGVCVKTCFDLAGRMPFHLSLSSQPHCCRLRVRIGQTNRCCCFF